MLVPLFCVRKRRKNAAEKTRFCRRGQLFRRTPPLSGKTPDAQPGVKNGQGKGGFACRQQTGAHGLRHLKKRKETARSDARKVLFFAALPGADAFF